jgi:vitamin B12 transporter
MNKKVIAGLISLAFYHTSSSATESINLDEVVVTASRTSQARENVIGDVTVIDRQAIERMGAGSITDLLRMQPGVQINANGGAGTSSSVYLRGTNDQHVVVLVDGLRINSATKGTTAYENIPLAQIERIEILRGPASSLYGADAIGGVIQIFTRKNLSEKPLINAAVGLGSFNTKTAEFGITGGVNALKYGVIISSMDTDSFSAKRIRTGVDSDNDGYHNLSASGFLELELKEGHSWGLQYFESKGRNHFDSGYNNYGNQTLQSYAFTSKNQFTDIWHSTFMLGMGIDDSDSHARPVTNIALSSYNPRGVTNYRTEQKQLTWQNDFKLPVGMLTLLYDRLEQDVDSDPGPKVKFKKERNNDGFMAGYLLDYNKHSVQLSVREDHNTQFGNYTTGGAGYGFRITPEWRVTANYGKAFKAPTFNQLYYPRITDYSGNPNLEPEKSRNREASVRYEVRQFSAGMTAFYNDIENLIVNGDPVKNVNQVNIQGVTFDGNWHITDNLTLAGNFTMQSPRIEKSANDSENDQLLDRRGNRYGAVSLQHTWGNLQWGSEVIGASTRYNDAANQISMSGYTLVNLTANYRISPEWKLEMRANNILDKNYVLSTTKTVRRPNNPDYNTAGSNLFVGLRYNMQ